MRPAVGPFLPSSTTEPPYITLFISNKYHYKRGPRIEKLKQTFYKFCFMNYAWNGRGPPHLFLFNAFIMGWTTHNTSES